MVEFHPGLPVTAAEVQFVADPFLNKLLSSPPEFNHGIWS